jgi:ABC-type glycerol-3-phosphate transport system substrate-binding protein
MLVSLTCSPELKLQRAEQRTLTLWHSYNNDETRVFNEIIADYQKQHPQIKIIAERVPFDGLLPKLISAAIAHRTPDIARVDIGHIPRLAWGKAIEPLDRFGAGAIIAGMHRIAADVARVQVPGQARQQIYAIPDQLTTVALYYNRRLLAEAGLQPPKNLGELMQMGAQLRNRGKSHKAFAMNASLWWMMPWFFLHNAQILSANLERCLLNSDEAVAALEYLRQLYTSGSEGGAWLSGAVNPDQGFLTGRYAMLLSGPWNLQTFKSIPFGVTLIPGHGNRRSASNIGGSAMVIFARSKQKEESFQLLQYLVSENVQKRWSRETGQLSVNQAASRSLAANMPAELKVFLQQLDYAGPRPQLPGYDALETIAAPYLYAALDGSLPVREALNRACVEIERDLLMPNR